MPKTSVHCLAALIVLLLVVPLGAAKFNGPDSVRARYDLGSVMSGTISGRCEASGILFPASVANNLQFESGGGKFLEHVVEMNSTQIAPPANSPREIVLAGRVQATTSQVPSGSGELSWVPTGRVVILGASPFEHGTKQFHADFTGSRLSASTNRGFIPTVTVYRDTTPGVLIPFFTGVQGPQRVMNVDQGRLEASGDLTIYVEGATAAFDEGTTHDVPPRYENVTRLGPKPLAEVLVSRLHYGIFQLKDAHLSLPVEGTQVLCRDLQAEVDGTIQLFLAHGSIERSTGNVSFDQQELGLTGRLDWKEHPEGRGVNAEGTGVIHAATIDFASVTVASGIPLATIGLWASIVAILGSVLYLATKALLGFFSRLTENRVGQHPGRAILLQTVRANPNVTLHSLAAQTGLHKSVVRYHARILEAKGLLRSHRVLRDRCFVARDTLQAQGRSLLRPSLDLVVRNDPVLTRMSTSIPSEGIRFYQLAQALSVNSGLTKQGAWKAVLRAEGLGLVERRKIGREVWIRCVS